MLQVDPEAASHVKPKKATATLTISDKRLRFVYSHIVNIALDPVDYRDSWVVVASPAFSLLHFIKLKDLMA